MTERAAITIGELRPRLPRGVRLTQHPQHGSVLLAPERVFQADDIATEILRRCSGEHSVNTIADQLAVAYGAPRERVFADVAALVQSLVDKRLIELGDAP